MLVKTIMDKRLWILWNEVNELKQGGSVVQLLLAREANDFRLMGFQP